MSIMSDFFSSLATTILTGVDTGRKMDTGNDDGLRDEEDDDGGGGGGGGSSILDVASSVELLLDSSLIGFRAAASFDFLMRVLGV